jgi:hypothetical protein
VLSDSLCLTPVRAAEALLLSGVESCGPVTGLIRFSSFSRWAGLICCWATARVSCSCLSRSARFTSVVSQSGALSCCGLPSADPRMLGTQPLVGLSGQDSFYLFCSILLLSWFLIFLPRFASWSVCSISRKASQELSLP